MEIPHHQLPRRAEFGCSSTPGRPRSAQGPPDGGAVVGRRCPRPLTGESVSRRVVSWLRAPVESSRTRLGPHQVRRPGQLHPRGHWRPARRDRYVAGPHQHRPTLLRSFFRFAQLELW